MTSANACFRLLGKLFLFTIIAFGLTRGAGAASPNGCTVSIASNFKDPVINSGSYIWFNSAFKPKGLGSTPVTFRFINQTISSANFGPLSVPDAHITFDPAATSATTSFTGGRWITRVPKNLDGNTFLSGLSYPVMAGLPGGIRNVTWSGTVLCDTTGVTMEWKWAAAVYVGFNSDHNLLGVKPVDDKKASIYQNSDRAGTPENYKSSVTGGATGGGGSNYTGDYSGKQSVTPCNFHDTSAPLVTILTPANSEVVFGPTATVTGIVQDRSIESLDPGAVTVKVNGINAEVGNGGFRAVNVPIELGPVTITAVATDGVGNTGQTSVRVLDEGFAGLPRLKQVSGDGQSGFVSTQLAQPLQVRSLGFGGVPAAGVSVTFMVARGDGSMPGGVRSATVISDSDGLAQVSFRLGTSAGAASDVVTATAPEFFGTATFSASAAADSLGARLLSVVTGADQLVAKGLAAPVPLTVRLSDSSGNPMSGQNVTFNVMAGRGLVNGAASATVQTDAYGRAFVVFAAGKNVGINSERVEASAASAAPVTFVASTLRAGNPRDTSATGIVLTETGVPIANVRVSVSGHDLSVLTDSEGRFQLSNLPETHFRLDADGTTAGSYSRASRPVDLVAGAQNVLDQPIYLALLDTNGSGIANPNTAIVLGRDDVPGLALIIPAGSATFDGGGKTGTVQLIKVRRDKLPSAPPDGALPRLAFSVLPANVHFDPPAPIRFPNMEGYRAGQIVFIYGYDHDLGTYYFVCSAQVSEDGSTVASEPGQGLVEGGEFFVRAVKPTATAVTGVAPTDLGVSPATNPLSDCKAQLLNISGRVKADGTFALYNVPADSTQVRVRVICTDANGATVVGHSPLATLIPGSALDLTGSPIDFSGAAPIPTQLTFAVANSRTSPGSTQQLVTTATYPDLSTMDVTAGASGTSYRVSNPNITSVSADGLVTGVSPGATIISALNDGAVAFAGMSIVSAPVASLSSTPSQVTVQLDPMIPSTPLQLAITAILIDTVTLDTTGSWAGTIYQSSDTNVVSVSADGIVIPRSPGNASITVTDMFSSLSVVVPVTVTGP